jgi:hypothetical protein
MRRVGFGALTIAAADQLRHDRRAGDRDADAQGYKQVMWRPHEARRRKFHERQLRDPQPVRQVVKRVDQVIDHQRNRDSKEDPIDGSVQNMLFT